MNRAQIFCTEFKQNAQMSVPTTSSSATSMNFIGFDEMKGNGTAPILFNRVVILPPPRETAGKWIHPVAGFLPGQQPDLQSLLAAGRQAPREAGLQAG